METTFKKDRARYMGIWTVMITLGVPLGPFIFGFVAYRAGYEWIYWVLAMVRRTSRKYALDILANSIYYIDQRGAVYSLPLLWTRNSLCK